MDDQHRIEPAPDGGVRFFLPPAERELLLQLRAELLSLLNSAPDDPSCRAAPSRPRMTTAAATPNTAG